MSQRHQRACDAVHAIDRNLKRLFPKRDIDTQMFDYAHGTRVAFRTVDGRRLGIETLQPPAPDLAQPLAAKILRAAYPRGWAQP